MVAPYGLILIPLLIHGSLSFDEGKRRKTHDSSNVKNVSTTASALRLSEKKCQDYSSQVHEAVIVNDQDNILQRPSALRCVHKEDLNKIQEIKKIIQFPHMAGIGWKSSKENFEFKCGGSLISPGFVLTAAHCTTSSPKANLTVRLGVLNIHDNPTRNKEAVDIKVRNIIIHPMYNVKTGHSDVALLKLERDVKFHSNIRPACLWSLKSFGGHKKTLATGWGVVNATTQRNPAELQKVTLDLFDSKECDVLLNTDKYDLSRRVSHDESFCAGVIGQEKGPCDGDYGGPLQIQSDDNSCIFYVIGVIVKDQNSCGYGLSRYTKVASYLDWIERIVWREE